ncbi:MAG TPA: TRAP transporter substrate-binding protein [Paracoccaceae bacterium]|nr:TRAP transporter substrate-binding protein [Paracoccaceae bacterium]
MLGASKSLGLLMAGSALALAAGITAAGAQSTDEIMERELSVVGSFSTSNLFPDYEEPFWTETLPEASGGKLTANARPFDQLGLSGAAVYDMVSQGVYDIGTTVMDYVAGDVPRVEGADIPAIADPALMREMIEAYKPALEKAFDETYDSKLLAVLPFSTQVVFCNTPISGLEDLAGKRIRGSGRMTLDFIEAIGATGVSVGFNEVPVALERGVIECGVTGTLSGYLAGWSEIATHFYPLPVGGWDPVGVVIRNDVWAELNEPTQTLLAEQLAGLEDKVWGDIDRVLQAGIACNTGGDCPYGEAEDLTLVEVTDADLQRALELTESSVLPQWAERCGAECVEFWNESAGDVLGIAAVQN